MTSFAIIAENAPKVNVKSRANGAFPPLVSKNTPHLVAAKRCESFDPSPHTTNTWTALRLSFEWHGDDVASFDDQIHTLVERNPKEATFRPIDQPTTRVIMCNDLLTSIIARTTYNLTTHNGEISFVNGTVITFRARTSDDGQRVIEEKRGKKRWKLFGPINPDGTVTPIIPSHLSKHAKYKGPRYAETAAKAQREIKIIQAKASLINDPTELMNDGVAISFKGSCRRCNKTLKKPESVANGIGPTCAKKEQ